MSGKREIACGVDVHNQFIVATIVNNLSFMNFLGYSETIPDSTTIEYLEKHKAEVTRA
jgi:hypothetical protein